MNRFLFLCFLLLKQLAVLSQKNDSKAWIAKEYKHCLEQKLPCQCESFNPPNIIFFNPEVDHFITLFETYVILQNDSISNNQIPLISRTNYIAGKRDSIDGYIDLFEDSILLFFPEKKMTYHICDDHREFENRACMNRINRLLSSNGHSEIEQELKSDSLTCLCDIQMGITRLTDGRRVWRIIEENNKLIIHRWFYPKKQGRKARKIVVARLRLSSKH